MYYDDEARRFNFASGLLLGAILGTGLALLGLPHKRTAKPRPIRGSADALKRTVQAGRSRIPDSLDEVRSALKRKGR